MTFGRSLPKWRHDLYQAALGCAARRKTPERSKAGLAVDIRWDDAKAVCALAASQLISRRVALCSSTKPAAKKEWIHVLDRLRPAIASARGESNGAGCAAGSNHAEKRVFSA